MCLEETDLHLEKTLSTSDNDKDHDRGAAGGTTMNDFASHQENLTAAKVDADVKETISFAKKLFRRHEKCDKDAHVPRFRCENNCNFDLCLDCFDYLTRKGDHDLSEEEERLLIEPGIAEMVQYLRCASLQSRQPTVPFSRNAYKRAVHVSGHTGLEERCEWLLQRVVLLDPEVENPIFVAGDVYDETLLYQLNENLVSATEPRKFSENARKRALFLTGNTGIESALTWLKQNADDPLMNGPVSLTGKVRTCDKGHVLVEETRLDQNRLCTMGQNQVILRHQKFTFR